MLRERILYRELHTAVEMDSWVPLIWEHHLVLGAFCNEGEKICLLDLLFGNMQLRRESIELHVALITISFIADKL